MPQRKGIRHFYRSIHVVILRVRLVKWALVPLWVCLQCLITAFSRGCVNAGRGRDRGAKKGGRPRQQPWGSPSVHRSRSIVPMKMCAKPSKKISKHSKYIFICAWFAFFVHTYTNKGKVFFANHYRGDKCHVFWAAADTSVAPCFHLQWLLVAAETQKKPIYIQIPVHMVKTAIQNIFKN